MRKIIELVSLCALVFLTCEGAVIGKQTFAALQDSLKKLEADTKNVQSEIRRLTETDQDATLEEKNENALEDLTEDQQRNMRVQDIINLLMQDEDIVKDSEVKEGVQQKNDAENTPRLSRVSELASSDQKTSQDRQQKKDELDEESVKTQHPAADETALKQVNKAENPIEKDIKENTILEKNPIEEADQKNNAIAGKELESDRNENDIVTDDEKYRNLAGLLRMLDDDEDGDWHEDSLTNWINRPQNVPRYIFDELAMDERSQ